MPIIKSAKKRVRVAKKNAIRNSKTKRDIKIAIKNFATKVNSKKNVSQTELSKAHSAIDTAVKKGVLSKNKAARKKSQLSKQAKENGLKIAKKATKTTAKPAPKKVSPKKTTTAKKTA